jgi:hypothetical protein
MSKQSTLSIFGNGSSNILRNASHFVTVTVKVLKSVAVADSNGNFKVLAGTILTAAGAVMTAADANAALAYGIVYEDVNFDAVATGLTEGVPVVIHGQVVTANLPVAPTTLQQAAMKGLVFVV